MTTPIVEISPLHRASVEAFLGLGAKAFEGAEQLTALNLQTARRLLSETQETILAVLSAKDPQEAMSLQSGLMSHAAEKASAYGKHVYEIATATTAELTKLASVGAGEAKAKWLASIDAAVKNAPAGYEGGATLMKTAFEGLNNTYEGLQQATQQATEAVESSVEELTESVVKSSRSGTGKRAHG